MKPFEIFEMKPFEISSTSSLDEFDNSWPYEPRYINNCGINRNPYGSRHPFYPTMGQPVVYCSQDVYPCDATPRTINNRSRDHRRGPNCFVKAFRWYTQEHVPASRCKNSLQPDISSFAAWLDVKYDQFLEESQMGSEMYHVKVRQTFEAERGPAGWKKKRRAKSNDGGVIQQRSNHSCHYIMKPRKEDMSRPPSVCCNPSCATTADSVYPNKSMCKSHSISNITLTIQNKEIDDAPTAQGDMGDVFQPSTYQNIKSKQNANTLGTNSNTSVKKTCGNISRKICSNTSVKKVEVLTTNRRSCADFCCQCEEATIPKKHTGTQYETVTASPNDKMSSVVTCKSEGPDYSCQTTVPKSTSRVTYESVRPISSVLPCQQGASCNCKPEQKASQKAVHNDSYRSVSKVYKNIECQCSREKVVTVDAQTQYSTRPGNTNNKCDCNVKGFVRDDATPVQSVPVSASRLCPCGGKVKEEVTEQYVKFAQTTSQTSSHSIYIEKKSARDYPLFLKIVCADKLSRENFK